MFCNRDLTGMSEEWTAYTSNFVTPSAVREGESWVRFGQWEVMGTIVYDNVRRLEEIP